MGKELMSWSAPEFEMREHGVLWYLGIVFCAAVLLLISLWQENFLFAIFVVLATSLSIFWSNKEPINYFIAITERGIKIGNNKFFSFTELSGFSLIEGGHVNFEWSKLVLQSKQWFSPLVAVFIPQGRLSQAREVLSKYLKEVPHESSLHDEVIRFLKL